MFCYLLLYDMYSSSNYYCVSVYCVAVYFEQGRYDECIKECQDAVDIGREHRADFKLIAK